MTLPNDIARCHGVGSDEEGCVQRRKYDKTKRQ